MSTIFFKYSPYIISIVILSNNIPYNKFRIIITPIIYNDQFPILIGLIKNALNAITNKSRIVIIGDHH